MSKLIENFNKVHSNLKDNWRSYGIVAIVSVVALRTVWLDFDRKVHWLDLYSESILRLAAGNVPLPGNGALPDVRKDTEHDDKPNPVARYIPPEAKVIITPKDTTKKLDDLINVKITNTWGFTRQPGLDISFLPLGVGLDFKWFYAYKLGTEVGTRANLNSSGRIDSVVPTLGLSYRLDRYKAFSNTELKLTYSPIGVIPIGVGIRVGFGN